MNELRNLLVRHSQWRKAQKALSWPEKIHLAEQVRCWAERWRSATGKETLAARKPPSNKP